jgi:hypothetical protein
VIRSLDELVVPGRVLRLFCSFTNPPKEKFVVIVATNPICLGFLINSNPTALQKSRKHLSDELIRVSARDGYVFLTNPAPSVLDCTFAADLDLEETLAQIAQDSSRVHRLISDSTRTQIINIVEQSMTLEGGISRIIIRNLMPS